MWGNIILINQWFEKLAIKIVRLRWLIIITLTLLTAIAISGLFRIKFDNSIEGWFMEGAKIKQAQDRFEEIFENSDYVALLIEAEDIFTPEILNMIRSLGNELENRVEFADKVISITDMEFSYAQDEEIIIENLVPETIPVNQDEIEKIRTKAMSKDFLVDRIYTQDSKMTWLMLKLHPFPPEEEYGASPINTVGYKVLEILANKKYKKYNIKATGMPVMAVEELDYAELEMGKLTLFAFLISIIILIIYLRSFRGVIIPLITTIISIILVFGFMGLSGIKINATMVSMPVFLGFAISIGYSIHILNFYQRCILITGKRKESVYFSIQQSGWPLLFTAITTIASLLSFCFIDLVPIQWLGITSAACVLSVYLVVMTLTPSLLSFGKNKIPKKQHAEKKELWSDKYYLKLGEWVFKNAKPVFIIFITIALILIYGMTKLEINLDTKRTYGKRVYYVNRMLEIAATSIGSFYSYDMTLEFKEPDAIKNPVILKKFETFINLVKKRNYTKRISSLLDIIKDMNQLLNKDNPAFYTIPDNQNMIAQLLFLYELAGGTEAGQWVDHDYKTLRLMVELDDMDARDIQKTMIFLEKTRENIFPEAELSIVGSLPQFFMLNHYIAIGQIKSFFFAIIVITLLLMLVFRSFKTGIIGMIPNITPAITIGGLMGFFNIPIDFMTVTMMPMILGLAVDDTIHFISHTNLEYKETGNYITGALNTYKMVGKALFMTSFILTASFLVYLTSTINMFINFGIFISIGIISALAADYLITPILINWTQSFGAEKKENN